MSIMALEDENEGWREITALSEEALTKSIAEKSRLRQFIQDNGLWDAWLKSDQRQRH